MKFNANLSVSIFKQGKRFIAYSPALDIATSGKNESEVKKRFGQLIQTFLEELDEMGTTEEVLSEFGWKKHKESSGLKSWMPPVISTQSLKVTIPTTT